MPLYKITFTDNSIFLGGETIEDSKWNEIPDKDILCLEYFLFNGSSIVLRDYEAYAAFTEALDDALESLGNCPKCNHKASPTSATLTYGDGSTKDRVMARCLNKEKNKDGKIKCGWVGRVEDVKDLNKKKGGRNKFIMGLKDGVVTSHRITLLGRNGEDKYKTGDVTTRESSLGQEYRNKPIAEFAWKKGIIKEGGKVNAK